MTTETSMPFVWRGGRSVCPPPATGAPYALVPSELKASPQWVCWCLGAARPEGKREKVPHDPRTGAAAKVNDPATWATFEEAIAAAHRYDGIGFVLTASSPFVGVDLDGCRNPETSAIEARARAIVDRLASYTEASPSGTGVHVIVRGRLPAGRRKRDGIEMYDRGRFFTVTGDHIAGTPMTIEARGEVLAALHAEVFGAAAANSLNPTTCGISPVEPRSLTAEDSALIERACQAADGEKFARLWRGEWQAGDEYPSQSEADLALASLLVGLIGRDASGVDALFRHSGLMRPKWDELRGAQTYGAMTIEKAIGALGPPATSRPGPSQPSARRRLQTVRLADVAPRSVAWLWAGRIPRGKLTLVIGDPGTGKSSLTLDLIARITTGRPWPDGGPAPRGNALILSAEDGIADTIRPRIDRMGGDPGRISVVDETARGFDLGNDLGDLEAEIVAQDVSVVSIDPLSAYLGKVDSFKDSEVRRLLAPLAAMAERTGVAIIGVFHLAKDTQRRAIYRALGSIAFAAAARAVFAVAIDPENDGRRLFMPVKLNLAKQPPTLAFRLDDGALMWEADAIEGLNVDVVLGEGAAGESGAQDDAAEFLRAFLAEREHPAGDVLRTARTQGISERTLRRAGKRLGVLRRHEGQPGTAGRWLWSLRDSHAAAMAGAPSAAVRVPMAATEGAVPGRMATFGEPSVNSAERPDTSSKVATSPDVAIFGERAATLVEARQSAAGRNHPPVDGLVGGGAARFGGLIINWDNVEDSGDPGTDAEDDRVTDWTLADRR